MATVTTRRPWRSLRYGHNSLYLLGLRRLACQYWPTFTDSPTIYLLAGRGRLGTAPGAGGLASTPRGLCRDNIHRNPGSDTALPISAPRPVYEPARGQIVFKNQGGL
jgi:hypothetical protein